MIGTATPLFEKNIRKTAQQEARKARLMAEAWYGGSREYSKTEMKTAVITATSLLYAIVVAGDLDVDIDNAIVAGVSMQGLTMVRDCISSAKPDGEFPPPVLEDLIVADILTDGEIL